MITYALDSNIITYLLKGDEIVAKAYEKEAYKGNICIIPPIVYYEVKRGLLYIKSASKLMAFEKLCRKFGIGEINIDFWDHAARLYVELRQIGKPTEDADIFIAAFCIVNDCILVTNNTRHFEAIDGLQYTNWK